MLAWRVWLTDRLTGDWLDGKAYYRARFIDDTIDNPISGSIRRRHLPAGNGRSPTFRITGRPTSCCSARLTRPHRWFPSPAILWNLSGMSVPVVGVEIPRAMFWVGLGYVLFASVIAFWIGRPIIWLSFNNEKFNAAFRYALVRLRDASEAVGFYRGKSPNARSCGNSSRPSSPIKRYLNRSIAFNGWNWSMSQVIVPLPYVLQFPRFVAGEIRLGDLTNRRRRSATSGRIVLLPQRVRPLRRLPGGDHPAPWPGRRQRRGRALPEVTTTPCVDGAVQLDDVEVRTPDGKRLIKPLTCAWKSATHW